MSGIRTKGSSGRSGWGLPRGVATVLSHPPIVDNDNGNREVTLECTGGASLPRRMCDALYALGFQVVAYHACVDDRLSHVRLTVVEHDGSTVTPRRRRALLALADGLGQQLLDAAE